MRCEGSVLRDIMVQTINLAYGEGRVLGTWQLSDAAQWDKHNGKEGPAAVRLINMLDPMGKLYYCLIFKGVEEDAYYFGYGFYQDRRREQAILVHHAVTWRLREAARKAGNGDKGNYSHVFTMRDVTNAFPSMKHEALTAMLESGTDARTAALLRCRHEMMEVRITTKGDRHVVLRPGCGGAQGDSIMPMEFRRTYEPRLKEWIGVKARDTRSNVTAKDGVRGEEVSVSETVFADDVKELTMATTAREATEAIARSTVLVDEQMAPMGLRQNKGKAEHVATFLGPGQTKETHGLREALGEAEMGDLRKAARYLGTMLTYDGSPSVNVKRRCRAAQEAYYSMGTLWRCGIQLKTRRMIFKGMVLNALLSGMEAEALRGCDYDEMDRSLKI